MIGSCGEHYVVFVHCEQRGQWLKFDDTIARVVGSWQDVLTNCDKGLVQPTLLMYDLVDSTTAAALTSASTAAAAVCGSVSSSVSSSSTHSGEGDSGEVSLQTPGGSRRGGRSGRQCTAERERKQQAGRRT
jgi:hypothetical protein